MKSILLIIALVFISGNCLRAQTNPVILEAETGVLGADWEAKTDGAVKLITPKTDALNQECPGSDDKVVTFKVTFPKAGTYDLYARVRVSAGGAKDDSFYYARNFGSKESTTDGGTWITCNGLHDKGYSDIAGEETVDENGGAKTKVWKWINLSRFSLGEPAVSFRVKDNSLVQTFQIGAREDGLEIDKIAFCPSSASFTVNALNKSN